MGDRSLPPFFQGASASVPGVDCAGDGNDYEGSPGMPIELQEFGLDVFDRSRHGRVHFTEYECGECKSSRTRGQERWVMSPTCSNK